MAAATAFHQEQEEQQQQQHLFNNKRKLRVWALLTILLLHSIGIVIMGIRIREMIIRSNLIY